MSKRRLVGWRENRERNRAGCVLAFLRGSRPWIVALMFLIGVIAFLVP